MAIRALLLGPLKLLTRDGNLIFLARFVRLFAYGSLSGVLVFYLIGLGLRESQVGILLTLTLVGDTIISLYITTRADRVGRRLMLIVGAILMAAARLAFTCTHNLVFLIIAGTIGVISPSGNEVGPFLPIEQAVLAHVVRDRSRTEVFAWYTLAGSVATATGALFAGAITGALQKTTLAPVAAYRMVVVLYAVLGVLLAGLFFRLSSAAEVHSSRDASALPTTLKRFFGIGQSHRVIVKLSSLFAVDSFAGGFRGAELRRVLVLPALWRPAGNSRGYFLLGHPVRGYFRAPGGASRCTLGLGQHHGSHASSFQHSAHSCPADAESLACGSGAPSTIQRQSDGRSHAAVLCHGGREQGRAIRGGRNHRRGPHNGSRDQPFVRWIHVCADLLGERAVLPRWRAKDSLRSLALQGVPWDSAR
jgi:MFS family permease